MKKRGGAVLHRILAFLSDRNLDLVTLMALGAILLGVNLWNGHWTTALFAGVLASFALSLIHIRSDLAGIRDERHGLASVFMHESPADLIPSFDRASELLLVGVSLDRSLRDAHTPLENFLARGGSLRVLLVDPESEWSVRIADRRAYHEHGYERRKQHIEASLQTFAELRDRTRGDVTVRLTTDPLTFGATMIDGALGSKHTRIIIQHYSFKKREAKEPNPVFEVRPEDGVWFSEFKEELENLWNSGSEVRG